MGLKEKYDYESNEGDYDDTLNLARNTTNSRLFLAIFFSFLTVAGSASIAVGELLNAPKGGSFIDDMTPAEAALMQRSFLWFLFCKG